MNSFTPTPANLKKLLAGETVVEFVEDERLKEGTFYSHDGWFGWLFYYPDRNSAAVYHNPPHSKGDVLWCREECWICERCKVISWTEEEILCRRCNGPHQKKLAEMVYAPANQMPEGACRLWVSVEDVGVETVDHIPEGSFLPKRDLSIDDALWALTLSPVDKPCSVCGRPTGGCCTVAAPVEKP